MLFYTACFIWLSWNIPISSFIVAQPHSRADLCLLLLVAHSVGELAGLHRGAGASRTPGASATAQTAYETAAYTTGQGAADCSIQLHMMAPESSSRRRSPTHDVQEASRSDDPVRGSARLRSITTCSLDFRICCCVSILMRFSATVSYTNIYMNMIRKSCVSHEDRAHKVTSQMQEENLSDQKKPLWFPCNFKPNECLVSELLLNVCPVSWCTAQQMQKLNVWHCNWGPLCNRSLTTLNAWLCFFALYPKFLLRVCHAFREYKPSLLIENCSKWFFFSLIFLLDPYILHCGVICLY